MLTNLRVHTSHWINQDVADENFKSDLEKRAKIKTDARRRSYDSPEFIQEGISVGNAITSEVVGVSSRSSEGF